MKLLTACALLGGALLAAPALAQTKLPTHRVTRPTPRRLPPSPPKPRKFTNPAEVENGYAAPGEPINVQDNGKATPPYDGPAAGHGNTPKGTTLPRKP